MPPGSGIRIAVLNQPHHSGRLRCQTRKEAERKFRLATSSGATVFAAQDRLLGALAAIGFGASAHTIAAKDSDPADLPVRL
jgi:hypothetical protein